MKGTGPAHLFVYYQMPYTINENGEVEDLKGAHQPIFVLSDGKFNSNMGGKSETLSISISLTVIFFR